MFANRWANLIVILIAILLLVPAAFVYGAYLGGTNMAKHFQDVETLGYEYGANETVADTPLLGSLLAKGLCNNLNTMDQQADQVPKMSSVSADYKMTDQTPLIRKACSSN